ncbi:hypothetical protein WT27_11530 [Burkholderia territorii]|uniref:Uncharacterized protein n=1 Tax=Burkholderia territorii TaxID=1503055 RepID=A0A119DPQ8_9BURK|nr:hypothetical protein WT27_11530 [Burkholderia territorii]KVX41139.1 hypothetical protein WT31_30475 [Burkholderia territorii]
MKLTVVARSFAADRPIVSPECDPSAACREMRRARAADALRVSRRMTGAAPALARVAAGRPAHEPASGIAVTRSRPPVARRA